MFCVLACSQSLRKRLSATTPLTKAVLFVPITQADCKAIRHRTANPAYRKAWALRTCLAAPPTSAPVYPGHKKACP